MIVYKVDENIALIGLNFNKYNVLSSTDLVELKLNFDKAKMDETVKGVILTGNETAFCAGIAIEKIIEEQDAKFITSFLEQNDAFLFDLFQFPKPIITIVNGHSIGEGLFLQLCSDYIIMENQSKIKLGLPELNIGLSLSPIMFHILEYYTTKKQIANLLYHGKLFNFEVALSHRFIDTVVEKEKAHFVANEIIIELLRSGLNVFQSMKHSIRQDSIQKMNRTKNDDKYKNWLIEMSIQKKCI